MAVIAFTALVVGFGLTAVLIWALDQGGEVRLPEDDTPVVPGALVPESGS